MPWIRLPFYTYAGAYRDRFCHHKIPPRSWHVRQGIRAIFLMVIRPSLISGTSISNRRCRKTGDVRDKNNLRIIVLVVYAGHHCTGCLSFTVESLLGICSVLGNSSSFPSSSSSSISFLPDLVYFRVDDRTYFINIFIINTVLFKFQNL